MRRAAGRGDVQEGLGLIENKSRRFASSPRRPARMLSAGPVVVYDGCGVEGRREVGDCVVSAAEAGEPCLRISSVRVAANKCPPRPRRLTQTNPPDL